MNYEFQLRPNSDWCCGSQCDKSSCWTHFHDWCQVPQLSILSFDVQADWVTRWHHVNTVWLHWAGQCFYHLWYTRTPVSGTLFSRSSEAESPWNLYLYQSWGICSRRPRTKAAALYFILIALSQASLSRALTPSAFVLCPVCCSAQMETSANSSRFSQPVENLEKALFKHHQHNNERETTNRKRFWETDMRKPATKFPILCNNNFHPGTGRLLQHGHCKF